MRNSLAKVIEDQDEIIRKQSELIAELTKTLENYMTIEEIENVEKRLGYEK